MLHLCVCTHFPFVLQGEGAWWELLEEFCVAKRHIYNFIITGFSATKQQRMKKELMEFPPAHSSHTPPAFNIPLA